VDAVAANQHVADGLATVRENCPDPVAGLLGRDQALAVFDAHAPAVRLLV